MYSLQAAVLLLLALRYSASGQTTGLSEDDQKEIINAHNFYRRSVDPIASNMLELVSLSLSFLNFLLSLSLSFPLSLSLSTLSFDLSLSFSLLSPYTNIHYYNYISMTLNHH